MLAAVCEQSSLMDHSINSEVKIGEESIDSVDIVLLSWLLINSDNGTTWPKYELGNQLGLRHNITMTHWV